jgi:acyl transferase domain-containing protein/NADPH:quinone reductase-like Zn-dependent oxidoreductase/short-subunit dehydrogenase
MLSADGRCKTFDNAANGFVRSEGCGIIVLKRLRAALEDGDRILALIRGSAVNQDGLSSGLSVPNGLAQEAVIRQALQNANLESSALSYIEAHGTGTALGDPIEIDALGGVFQKGRNPKRPVALGSVKTNLGHLEAASGMAGLLKVVLMLGHGQIPPHLHLKQPSAHIAWENYPFVIPTKLTDWEPINGKRIAGISSFGFSGSNAHVILEEAPEANLPANALERPCQLLTLSARNDTALHELARRIETHLERHPALHFPDLCFTANAGRSHFGHRLSVLSSTTEEARQKLSSFLAGQAQSGLVSSRVSGGQRPKIAFLFTGQGSQYAGMGLGLYETSPTFRHALDRCDELLSPHLDRPLLSVLYSKDPAENLLGQTIYTQPAVFSLEYALSELWRSWGVQPSFVLGHSVGEYVAACVAGIFSLEDGLRLIVQRARLMQAEPIGGGMIAVHAEEELVREAIEPFIRSVSVAAINGPRNVVISGPVSDLNAVVDRLAANKVACKNLNVSHAFHSPLMEPLLPEFEKAFAGISLQPPAIRLISNLTGRVAKSEEITQPAYWLNHLRRPVQFSTGIQTLVESGCGVFLELGASPVLLAMGRECAPKSTALWLPTIRRGRDDWSQTLASLQSVYHAGGAVNWKGFDAGYTRRRIQLPTYPFQREHFWFEHRADAVDDRRTNQFQPRLGGHPLLGVRLHSPALRDTVFQSQLSAQNPAFLADHQICGRVILPATAYVEMALAAADKIYSGNAHSAGDISFQEALQLDFESKASLQTIFRTTNVGSATFEIFSDQGDGQDSCASWTRNVSGRVGKVAEEPARGDKPTDLQAVRDRCLELVDPVALYQELKKEGAEFGPLFRNIHALWRGTTESLAEIVLDETLHSEIGNYRFHPALLDACFQAAAQALPGPLLSTAEGEVLLPINIEKIQIWRNIPTKLWSHGRLRGKPDPASGLFTLDLEIYDSDQCTLGKIEGLQLKRVKRETLDRVLPAKQRMEKDWLFEVEWRAAPGSTGVGPDQAELLAKAGSWLILADSTGASESLRRRLISAGQRCILARPGSSFVRQSTDQFELDPTNAADFKRLIEEACFTPQLPLRGVLHLWSLNFAAFETMTGEDLASSQLLGCGAALHLVQALGSLENALPPNLWLVTRGAQAVPASSAPVHPAMASLTGLGRVIASEHPELRCRLLDLNERSESEESAVLFAELANRQCDEDVMAFRDDARWVPRLVRLSLTKDAGDFPQQISNPLQLEVSRTGVIENLRWSPTERIAPGPGEVEIKVQATGLNFRDVLCALGMYPGKVDVLGAECAGVVTRVGESVRGLEPGNRVMAVAKGGFSTYVTVRADHATPVPAGISINEAASIPVAFLTAFFGLHHLARMKTGDRVLIHAAAGGVGLAAVQLAQRTGAEIFATAGNPEKRSHLQTLGVINVFDSRSLDFAEEILRRTDGRGVDIILNSLAGDFIEKSVSVLAPGGRFLEIGKRGILSKEQFSAMCRDGEYYAFDLGEKALEDPSLLPGIFNALLPSFSKKELQPLPLTTFPHERMIDAFRFMAQAKQIGKIIVTKPAVTEVAVSSPRKLGFRKEATYLITGGLGGLGLQTARWMVREGARSIVLMGRCSPDREATATINELIQSGARIVFEKCDVSDQAAVAKALSHVATSMPPLRGIVHAAGVLDDGMLEQQTWSRFREVMAPKVFGSWNLHRLTLSAELDFFVLFSAAAGLIGSPGQGNYSAANSFMDGLAHHRKAKGLPALSIDWSGWAEAGMATRLAKKDEERWTQRGMRPIHLEEGMAQLGDMLSSSGAQIIAAPIVWSKMFGGSEWDRLPSLFSEIVKLPGTADSSNGVNPKGNDIVARISVEPAGRRLAILKAHVELTASRALGATAGKSLDPLRPLHELGLDSLMSVELRNALATSLDSSLPATLLFDFPTIESLTSYLAKNVLHLEIEDRKSPEDGAALNNDLERLREMSESEAESLLLAELDGLKK